MKYQKLITCFILSVSFTGCANLNSVYRPLNSSSGKGALIDIKQRAILVHKKSSTEEVKTELKTGKITTTKNDNVVICAEPSPDAMSAYAAELAGKVNLPEGINTEIASALQESASFTGLRTSSIQLLRDSMYRTCEAYMNGAIDKPQYDILSRRYQKYTVALLAIEQLTGAIKAPPITINTTGSADLGSKAEQIKTSIAEIDKSITSLDEQKAKLSDQASAEAIKIDSQIKEYKATRTAREIELKNAVDAFVFGTATAQVSSVGMPTQRSDAHILAVNNTVRKIVLDIINTDDFSQLCFSFLTKQPTDDNTSDMNKICKKQLELVQKQADIKLQALEKAVSLAETIDEINKVFNDLSNDLNHDSLNLKGLFPKSKYQPLTPTEQSGRWWNSYAWPWPQSTSARPPVF